MAISPYGLIAPKQTMLEGMLKSQQAERRGREETTAQMGKMGKEFEEQLVAAEQKAEKALQQRGSHRKKRKWYQKALTTLAPILLGAATGGAGAGWIGGLSGIAKGHDVYSKGKKDIDWARGQARKAKEASLAVDPRFGKTFLSSGLTKYKGAAEKKYGGILSQAERMDKSDVLNQALMSGLIGGVSGYGGATLGGKLGEAFKGAAGGEGGFFKELFGKQSTPTSEIDIASKAKIGFPKDLDLLTKQAGKGGVGIKPDLIGPTGMPTPDFLSSQHLSAASGTGGVGVAPLKEILGSILSGERGTDPSRIMEAFTGAGDEMKGLLGGEKIEQSLPLLMMLLQQYTGGE